MSIFLANKRFPNQCIKLNEGMESLPSGMNSPLFALIVPGGVQMFWGADSNSGNAVASPDTALAWPMEATGIFTGFYFLRGIFKFFARTGCINQTVVSQRHRLCLLEPERDL